MAREAAGDPLAVSGARFHSPAWARTRVEAGNSRVLMSRDTGASIQRKDATATAQQPAATASAAIAPPTPFMGGSV